MYVITIALLSHSHIFAGEYGRVRLPDELKIRDAKSFQSSSKGMDSQIQFAKTNQDWKIFLANNPTWQSIWNPLTNNPHRAWGMGIHVDGYTHITASNAANAGWKFIRDNSSVLNIHPDELRLLQAENVNGKWYYKFKQKYKGLDVLNTFVDVRMTSDGKVFLIGSDFIPQIDVDINPNFNIDAAKEFAKVGLDYIPGVRHITDGQLFILPLKYDSRIETRLVYHFVFKQSHREVWNTFVDAHTGEVLWRYNLVKNFSGDDKRATSPNIIRGNVTATVYPVSYLFAASQLPLSNTVVNINGVNLITNGNGEFAIDIGTDTSAFLITRMSGPYALVRRGDTTKTINPIRNAKVAARVSPRDYITIKWDDNNSHLTERNAFYHLNVVKEFIRSIDPSSDLSDLDNQLIAYVQYIPLDQSDSCNAMWNGGTLQFYKETFSCANPALIADVIYHEYGHAINEFYYQQRRGEPMFNYALGEATADIVANMLRDSPEVAPGFYKGQPFNGILRTSDNTKKYPDDIVNEEHLDAMILTGAVWDMRKAIGIDAARTLTHFAKKGTPDGTNTGEAFADYFIELLVADDDDGDLSNGTPHSSGIIPAFMKHGIPTIIKIDHVQIGDQDGLSSANYPIQATVSTLSIPPTSIQTTVKEASVIWSIDNWKNYFTNSLTINSGTNLTGIIPSQKAGSILRYYLDVIDNFGVSHNLPSRAPIHSYLFLVGYQSKFLDKMESNDGWIIDPDNTDNATSGKWIRDIPIGTIAQPGADHSPGDQDKMCWVTGNAPANTSPGENDVDDGKTTLQTIAYDLTKYKNPVIRYWRWYSNDHGSAANQDEWVVQISNDDGRTWKDLERTKQSIDDWSAMVFSVKDFIQLTDKMRVRFISSDYPPSSLVEAAVDDFEILDVNPNINTADDISAPNEIELKQNYPNPFSASSIIDRSSTFITYSLPTRSFVSLKVYNSFGQEVKTLISSSEDAGTHTVTFNAVDLPTGMYFYELITNGKQLVKKMMYGR